MSKGIASGRFLACPKTYELESADVSDAICLISGPLLGPAAGLWASHLNQVIWVKCSQSIPRLDLNPFAHSGFVYSGQKRHSAKICNYLKLQPRLRELCVMAKSHDFAQTFLSRSS